MILHMLKSKIHRARVTDANVDYEGSLSIDRELMDAVGMLPYERILCTNASNGARFETYAIPAEPGLRQIVLNGAAAYQGRPGDRLTIMSFAEVAAAEVEAFRPRVIVFGTGDGDYSVRESCAAAGA